MSQLAIPDTEGRDQPAGQAPAHLQPPDEGSAAPARSHRVLIAAGMAALAALALAVRLPGMGISLWLDEGLSVGIASHRLADIPGLLAQDGSPPLYYLLLHGWMELFGRSEEAVRALSLVAGLACIPVAFWAGRTLFGRRAGWIAAVLAASSPYLSLYSREARMYTLMVLVSLVCVTAFVAAFAFGDRRMLPLFSVFLALALYTHNWGLYLVVGLGAATVVCVVAAGDRRRVVLDAGAAFGAAGLLYLPWMPTLVFQAARTGAPWSQTPDAGDLWEALESVLGDRRVVVMLALVGVPALVRFGRRWRSGTGLAVAMLAVTPLVAAVAAWLSSQVEPAWASRYFAVFLVPVLLLVTLGLAREGRRGLLALLLIVMVWTDPVSRLPGFGPSPRVVQKSNVRAATELVADMAGPGDLVVSTHMEHVPLLRYYLGPQPHYADPSGLVADPTMADWRDGLARMRSATPERGLVPLTDDLATGANLLLVCPRLDLDEDDPEWFVLMQRNCNAWRSSVDADPSLELVRGPVSPKPRRSPGSSVYIVVYEKVAESETEAETVRR